MNQTIPQHVSFVLDGNRRWAKRQGLPSLVGHLNSVEVVMNLIEWCNEVGVKYLTVYAFSTENWSRAKEELDYLFGTVFPEGLKRMLPKLMALNVKANLFGEDDRFPEPMRQGIREVVESTRANTGLVWNVCLDYGGRAEIVRAVRRIVQNKTSADQITDQAIADQLDSAGMPDPDLMIRTGGEHRLSNFLLWQQAYTELYFPEVGLPGFTRADFDQALEWYASRDRRYGK